MRVSIEHYKELKSTREKYKRAIHALKLIASDTDETHIREYAEQQINAIETLHAPSEAR